MRLHLVLLTTLVICLACGGLYPEADLVEVDRHVAVDAGYTLPVEARAIHVRDRATGDVRTTWFLYTMPPESIGELRSELEDDPGVIQVDTVAPPENWPDFGGLGFEAPDWWLPGGAVFRRELRAEPGVVAVPGGRMWALVEGEGQVFTWMWTWEGWDFGQAGATGGGLAPAGEAPNIDDEPPTDVIIEDAE